MQTPLRLLVADSSRTRRLWGYIFSPVLVALTTIILREVQIAAISSSRNQLLHPYGIAYIIALIFASILGGWICGAMTLLLSLAAIDLFLMAHSAWNMAPTPPEMTELMFVALVGVAVIVAVETLLHNARLSGKLALVSEQRQIFLRDVLVSVTDGKLNLVDRSDQLPTRPDMRTGIMQLERDNLGAFRRLVSDAAAAAELPRDRAEDLVTAASECAMNAVVHGGGGTGAVYVCGKDSVQVWVEDQGRGIALEDLPSATLEKGYTTAGTMGFGMKMTLSAVDRLWLLTGPTGTTVVLDQFAAPQQPAWLLKNHGELFGSEAA